MKQRRVQRNKTRRKRARRCPHSMNRPFFLLSFLTLLPRTRCQFLPPRLFGGRRCPPLILPKCRNLAFSLAGPLTFSLFLSLPLSQCSDPLPLSVYLPLTPPLAFHLPLSLLLFLLTLFSLPSPPPLPALALHFGTSFPLLIFLFLLLQLLWRPSVRRTRTFAPAFASASSTIVFLLIIVPKPTTATDSHHRGNLACPFAP
mmetsp:Transcript_53868/g.87199  ORF Transcript_53868/g.87199 Transcript_53868/m.87199 type:complete len:201 (-) Transcript_53868:629-1231(-)